MPQHFLAWARCNSWFLLVQIILFSGIIFGKQNYSSVFCRLVAVQVTFRHKRRGYNITVKADPLHSHQHCCTTALGNSIEWQDNSMQNVSWGHGTYSKNLHHVGTTDKIIGCGKLILKRSVGELSSCIPLTWLGHLWWHLTLILKELLKNSNWVYVLYKACNNNAAEEYTGRNMPCYYY